MDPRHNSTRCACSRSPERVAWCGNPRREDAEDEIYRVVERQ